MSFHSVRDLPKQKQDIRLQPPSLGSELFHLALTLETWGTLVVLNVQRFFFLLLVVSVYGVCVLCCKCICLLSVFNIGSLSECAARFS